MPHNQAVPGVFQYRAADASNVFNAPLNSPVDIPAGAPRQFVFGFTPSATFAATDIRLVFDCENTQPVTTFNGLNTFLLSSSSTPVPDMVAISATATNNGIMNVPPTSGAFATAAINIGAAGTILATVDTGSASLPLALGLCQTDAAGACLVAPAGSASVAVPNNGIVTFAIFGTASGAIPLDPAISRVFLRLSSDGVVRGATSVAVQTTASDAKLAVGR